MKSVQPSLVTTLGADGGDNRHIAPLAESTSGAAPSEPLASDDSTVTYTATQSPKPQSTWLPRVRTINPNASTATASTTSTRGPCNNRATHRPAHPYTTPAPSRISILSSQCEAVSDATSDSIGALRPGGAVDLLARANAGLLINYFVVGLFNGVLPGLVYPFFKVYLDLEGYQTNAVETLLMFAWYFKFVFGIITDCVPIRGYRRKPYIVGGWVVVSVIMTVMALAPVTPPHRLVPPNGPIENEHAADAAPSYVVPLMLVTIGYLFADVACDGLMVEFAQRESERTRGRAQLTVYATRFLGELAGALLVALGLNSALFNGTFRIALRVNDVFWVLAAAALVAATASIWHLQDHKVTLHNGKRASLAHQIQTFWRIMQQRATWQLVLYGFTQKLGFAFDVAPANAITQTWLHADSLTRNLFRSATTGVYALGSITTHRFLLNANWRLTVGLAIVATVSIGSPVALITVFDVYRNVYFYLAKDLVVSFFDALAMMVRILVIVEIAEPGFESSTYGLVTTVYNLAGPSATALSNYVGAAFDVYNSDIKADTAVVRWHVAACFGVMYAARIVLPLAVLPLLPSQKPAARALKRDGGTQKRTAAALFSAFGVVFVGAIALNLMSIFRATSCLKIVGGDGCR